MSDESERNRLSPEEVDAAGAEELPEREVMSTLGPPGIDEIGRFPDMFEPGPVPEGTEEKPGPQPA